MYVAYFLKEEFCEFWNQEDYDTAEDMLVDWLAHTEALGIPELISFCKTIRNHALGMLAYHNFNITTSPLEGLNNKTKTLKRQAYGFHNDEYFKLKNLRHPQNQIRTFVMNQKNFDRMNRIDKMVSMVCVQHW